METIIVSVKAVKSDKPLFERILENQIAKDFDFQSTSDVLFNLYPNLEVQITFSIRQDKQIKIPVFV